MTLKKLYLLWAMGCCLLMTSCLYNDYDYPYINGRIEDMAVEGQSGNAVIDESARTVKITLADGYDIDSLQITKMVITDEAQLLPDSAACLRYAKFPNKGFASVSALPVSANTCMRFSNPVKILLKTYQEYWWTVTVTQNITRSIEIENQVGEPVIDTHNKTAIVYVSSSQRLNDITINRLEPEGENTILVPSPEEVKNFNRPQKFRVYKTFENGKVKDMGTWTIDVLQTESAGAAEVSEVWARKAILKGGISQGADLSIEYKKTSDSNWNKVSSSAITNPTATSFTATISGLTDGTKYNWQTIVNGTTTAEGSFTTETIAELQNLNFDNWTQDDNKDRWYPNNTAADTYWATGNSGLSIAKKDNVTQPTNDAVSGKAAKLTSITDVILVGAAAGNLFIGSYKTNTSQPAASVTFGRPFTSARPTGLTGYYKYFPAKINYPATIGTNTRPQTPLGTDQAHIYLKVWDANDKEIGYGEFTESSEVDSYTQFKFGVIYTDKTAIPAKITIVATSSKYGGEFDGMKVCGQVGNGSTLYVDEFELLYD